MYLNLLAREAFNAKLLTQLVLLDLTDYQFIISKRTDWIWLNIN